jgi:hypothetical protein
MDPLDRRLAEAVNVDPSPEFIARVRARVAAEGSHARRRTSPLFVAGAAVAATLAIAVWMIRADRVPGETTMADGHLQLDAAQTTRAKPPQQIPAPIVRTVSRRRPAIQVADQVIVADDEVRGLRQLADLVRGGRVVVTFAEDEHPDETERPRLPEIVVAPLDIAPLTVASNMEKGDEQ